MDFPSGSGNTGPCMRIALLCAGLAAGTPVAATQAYFDANLSLDHDTNVGNASHRGDELDDNILIFGMSANRPQPLTEHSGLLLTGSAEYDRYTAWPDLSHFTGGGRLAWRFQPGTSYDAVWYEIAAGASLLQYQDSDLRDGGSYFLDLGLGSRLTDRLQVRAGYRYSARRAWEAAVFDNDDHRLYANADWQAGDRLTVYGTVGWQTGDVVSTSRQDNHIDAISTADAPDRALGTWNGQPRVAYRIDADTVTGELGFNYALGPGLAIDASARYLHSDGPGTLTYEGIRVLAGLLYRF